MPQLQVEIYQIEGSRRSIIIALTSDCSVSSHLTSNKEGRDETGLGKDLLT